MMLMDEKGEYKGWNYRISVEEKIDGTYELFIGYPGNTTPIIKKYKNKIDAMNEANRILKDLKHETEAYGLQPAELDTIEDVVKKNKGMTVKDICNKLKEQPFFRQADEKTLMQIISTMKRIHGESCKEGLIEDKVSKKYFNGKKWDELDDVDKKLFDSYIEDEVKRMNKESFKKIIESFEVKDIKKSENFKYSDKEIENFVNDVLSGKINIDVKL